MEEQEYYQNIPIRKQTYKPAQKPALDSLPIENIKQKKIITFTRFIYDIERMKPEPSYEFVQLMAALQTLTKTVSSILRNSGLGQRYVFLGHPNNKPYEMKKTFEDLILQLIVKSKSCCSVVIKDVPDIIQIEPQYAGKYLIAISVLDRDMSLDASTSMGTSFVIFRKSEAISKLPEDEILQPGRNAICAGFVVYGNATSLIFALKSSVKIFSLDTILGEYIMIHDNWKIPDPGYIYSINEGYSFSWDPRIVTYLNVIKHPRNLCPWEGKYSGSIIADCYRILQLGGIYLYPTNYLNPTGKVGLLYEGIPLAFVAASAGGAASSGTESILHITPHFIHQRVPFFFGSAKHLNIFKRKYIQEEDDGTDYENVEYFDGGGESELNIKE